MKYQCEVYCFNYNVYDNRVAEYDHITVKTVADSESQAIARITNTIKRDSYQVIEMVEV